MNPETIVINGIRVLPSEEIQRMIKEAQYTETFKGEMARAGVTG